MNTDISKLILLGPKHQNRNVIYDLDEPLLLPSAIRMMFTDIVKKKGADSLSKTFGLSRDFFTSLMDRELLI